MNLSISAKRFKGGTADSLFKAALIIILILIAYFLYMSWVYMAELVTLGKQPPTPEEGGKELNEYIGDYNDLFKQILDFFL